jgi:hypothetical protein
MKRRSLMGTVTGIGALAPPLTPIVPAQAQVADLDDAINKAGRPDARGMAKLFTTSERILQTMDGVTGMFSKQGLPA